MVKLPGGFSPVRAFQQAGSILNPAGGVADYDVFSDVSVRGGDRYPVNGGLIGPQNVTSQNQPGDVRINTGPIGGGAVQGAATGGGGIAQAQDTQQIAGLRNEIIARRDRANSIFDALTGAISALAQEKRGGLEQQFQQQQQQATEDFTNQSGQLARAYRGRGIGDSSFKVNALDAAGNQFQRAIQDLGSQRQSGLAKVGSESEVALARLGADRGSLAGINIDEVGRRDDGTVDITKLAELRDSLDDRIRQAQVQQTELGTESGFRGKLDQIAPYGGTTEALRGALNSLIQAAVPKAVKDRLASAIISNYAPTDAGVWQQYYEEQNRQTATG